MNAEQVANIFGCTSKQVRTLYAKNAAQLASMANKSAISGHKVNGYTAAQLLAYADKYKALAQGKEA